MNNLNGWKTLLANGLLLAFSAATALGVVVPEDEKQASITGIVAIAGIVLRLVTKTPVGKSE